MLSEGLQVRLGDNVADINIEAKKLYSKPINLKADISSQRFQLEPLLQASAGSVVATNQNEGNSGSSKGNSPPEELGPFDIPLYAVGTITVAETVWKGLAIKDFVAQYELKDNVFRLIRMDGQVAGGGFSNSARVDLGKKGLIYSADLGLKGIQSDPLITAFVPKASGSLFGAMNLVFKLEGSGTEWQTIKRYLSGNGNVHVVDGRLVSPVLMSGLSSFLQMPELNDIQFDNFDGQFKVIDGIVKVDGKMLSKTLKLFPQGTVGLDGSLQLALDTRLSPELSSKLDQKSAAVKYLADNDGWTRLPILLNGSLDSPSFGLDPKGLQEQAAKALNNELGRQIEKLFKHQDSSQESGMRQAGRESSPEKDSKQQLLQDSLQKLFGN
jgi:AsmA protein